MAEPGMSWRPLLFHGLSHLPWSFSRLSVLVVGLKGFLMLTLRRSLKWISHRMVNSRFAYSRRNSPPLHHRRLVTSFSSATRGGYCIRQSGVAHK